MSKIVAVMGSPNSFGNTAGVVDAVLDGAMGLSTNIIKLYHLGKLNYVHGCTHCLRCCEAKKCVQVDDLGPVLLDIHSADVVIFATPMYFNMPTAQFKMVFDRMYADMSVDRSVSKLAGKKAIIAVTCGQNDENAFHMVDLLSKAIEAFGFEITDRMVFSDDCGHRKFSADKGAYSKAREIGAQYSTNAKPVVHDETLVL
ncbi:MAG: flavodoxin family protein [archaeon]|nr:flavodoxin family protein [archaeon]